MAADFCPIRGRLRGFGGRLRPHLPLDGDCHWQRQLDVLLHVHRRLVPAHHFSRWGDDVRLVDGARAGVRRRRGVISWSGGVKCRSSWKRRCNGNSSKLFGCICLEYEVLMYSRSKGFPRQYLLVRFGLHVNGDYAVLLGSLSAPNSGAIWFACQWRLCRALGLPMPNFNS